MGEVTAGEAAGCACVLSTRLDHPCGLVLPEAAAKKAMAFQGAPVELLGHGRVGRVSGVAYGRADGALRCYFVLDPGGADALGDARELFAWPSIDAGRIGCLTCGRAFARGDAGCACLRTTPRIVLHDFSVSGLSIAPATQHHPLEEVRADLVLSTTASVLANLLL